MLTILIEDMYVHMLVTKQLSCSTFDNVNNIEHVQPVRCRGILNIIIVLEIIKDRLFIHM